MRGQRNFQPAIPLAGFFDESFRVQVPQGRIGTGLEDSIISHPFQYSVKRAQRAVAE
jgi:hypothetical protein